MRLLSEPAKRGAAAILGRVARHVLARQGLTLHCAEGAVRNFGISGSHCFFGYYDVTPFDRTSQRLLAGRTVSSGRRAAGTELELGYFDLCEHKSVFTPFGRTTTWCWQQGARLQWLEAFGPDCVIYNRTVAGMHGSVVQDITTGTVLHEIAAPVYAVHPKGHTAISLNFARLQRLRPGYGYDDIPDFSQEKAAPADDGLWHVDLKNGEQKLIFSLAQAAGLAPQESMRDAEHYFNHAAWNPSGSRFLVFHIWQVGNRRLARAMTMDADGGSVFLITNESHVSHYCWLDDQTLLLTSTHADTGTRFHVYRDGEGRAEAWPREVLPLDGHPSLSPKGRWLLCDTLQNLYRERTLFLYDIEAKTRVDLASFYTPPDLSGERRCDLHPRWNRMGLLVCVDASHTGVRTMMTLDVSALLAGNSTGP